jgi:5'-3' exoribonuclease 2
MNGIVHPCTHPEGRPAPETEQEMMVEVFRYTERVVNMARPRKVLMMAIDGVAPRAKMNQQRSRRFRSAQEAQEKEIERQEAIKMYEAMGNPVSEETKNKKAWDSNAITPGTPFMDLLSKSLKYWVAMKLSTDPGWKDVSLHLPVTANKPAQGHHLGRIGPRRGRAQDCRLDPPPALAPDLERQHQPRHVWLGCRPHHAGLSHPRAQLPHSS